MINAFEFERYLKCPERLTAEEVTRVIIVEEILDETYNC